MKQRPQMDWIGQTVLSRDGALTGTIMRELGRCTLEGCTGHRLSVKWKDSPRTKGYTFPCTKSLKRTADGDFQLI